MIVPRSRELAWDGLLAAVLDLGFAVEENAAYWICDAVGIRVTLFPLLRPSEAFVINV